MTTKILAYLRHYPPPLDGGAYNYNWHLIDELCKSGLNITVMTHKGATYVDTPSLKVYPIQSIKTGRYLYATRVQQIRDILSSIYEVRKMLAREKFDWILTDAGYIQNLIVSLGVLPNQYRIIGINLSEEIASLQKTTRVRGWLQGWLLRKHTCNIVISKSTERMLTDLGVTARIMLVYPCIDPQPRLDKSIERKKLLKKFAFEETDLIVGFLGRHILRKGIHNLILAVCTLRRSGLPVNLLIAGQGPQSNSLRELICENHGEAYCKLIGRLPDEKKETYLSGIDVFAMPNFNVPETGDAEGFGIAFLEAAQQGTPVIGGMDGGAPEAILAGFNGVVVDGQNIDRIVEAIETYYSDPVLRKHHGENGKTWAGGFNWQDQVKPLIDFINFPVKL